VTESKPEAKADLASVLNTSLGDLLVAGLVRNPEDAGRFIRRRPQVDWPRDREGA
jgi:hypothetical protein